MDTLTYYDALIQIAERQMGISAEIGQSGIPRLSVASGDSFFTVDAAQGNVSMSENMKEALLAALDLAETYTDLQYVASNGSYVITDLALNGDYKITFRGQSSKSGSIVVPYTAHSSSTMRQGLVLFNTASHKVAPYWPGVSWSDQPVPASIDFNSLFTIVQDRNGIAIDQGENVWEYAYSGSVATDGALLRIFGSANASHADYNAGVFEYLTVERGGNVVAHFIPRQRDSDGTAGIYDTVSRKFYESLGGAFIAGPAA